jgi:hypothetical protein
MAPRHFNSLEDGRRYACSQDHFKPLQSSHRRD